MWCRASLTSTALRRGMTTCRGRVGEGLVPGQWRVEVAIRQEALEHEGAAEVAVGEGGAEELELGGPQELGEGLGQSGRSSQCRRGAVYLKVISTFLLARHSILRDTHGSWGSRGCPRS